MPSMAMVAASGCGNQPGNHSVVELEGMELASRLSSWVRRSLASKVSATPMRASDSPLSRSAAAVTALDNSRCCPHEKFIKSLQHKQSRGISRFDQADKPNQAIFCNQDCVLN